VLGEVLEQVLEQVLGKVLEQVFEVVLGQVLEQVWALALVRIHSKSACPAPSRTVGQRN
jgi:hypothetical protein